jgi:hypothetical protein
VVGSLWYGFFDRQPKTEFTSVNRSCNPCDCQIPLDLIPEHPCAAAILVKRKGICRIRRKSNRDERVTNSFGLQGRKSFTPFDPSPSR